MTRHISRPTLLVLALVAALTLGFAGTATAGGMTAKAVKKIAAKVVTKKAPGLSVAKAKTADTATTATTATNATQLGGAAPSAYRDRVAHENLTTSTALTADLVAQIMNPTLIEVPAGVGFVHVTAVANFEGGNDSVEVWAQLDGNCSTSGAGYQHRSSVITLLKASVAVDFVAPVAPGQHNVRLCAGPKANTTTTTRSMTIQTVAGGPTG